MKYTDRQFNFHLFIAMILLGVLIALFSVGVNYHRMSVDLNPGTGCTIVVETNLCSDGF